MENDTARGLWFVEPRRVEIRDVMLRETGAEDLVVRTAFSGISPGTEMLAYRGEVDQELVLDDSLTALTGRFAYPFRYGYSCVGRVERGAGEVAAGAAVFAFHPHQDRFVVEAAQAIPVEGVDLRAATLFPLVETALQVALDADPAPRAVVVVMGLGVVGVLSALLLQRAGAHVLASDPLPGRRELASSVGLETVAPDALDDAAAEATDAAGVPLVVEVSGNPAALTSGLRLLAHEGTALVVSWYGTKQVSLPLGAEFHRRRLTIRSSQVSTIPSRLAGEWTFERRRNAARDLLHELPLDAIATHSFPFPAAAHAFEQVDHPPAGLLHAALCYE